MKYSRKTFSLFIFLFLTVYFYAENFRVGSVYTYTLEEGKYESFSTAIRYNDAISLAVNKNFLFLNGIELHIKQDQAVLEHPNMIAYGIYNRISSIPKKRSIDYSGIPLITNVLPAHSTHIITIPLKKNHGLKQELYSDLAPYDEHITESPILFRLHPVMKGIPESVEKTKFKITVRPLLRNEGGLKVNLIYPKKEEKYPVDIHIDNHYLNNFSDLQIIAPGTYSIALSSEHYRSEVRSCIIEKGKITQVDITLKSIIPLLCIEVPSKVTVLIDNTKTEITNTPIALEPGIHTITVQLGEYETVRQFLAEEGKSYHFTMNINTELKELK